MHCGTFLLYTGHLLTRTAGRAAFSEGCDWSATRVIAGRTGDGVTPDDGVITGALQTRVVRRGEGRLVLVQLAFVLTV